LVPQGIIHNDDVNLAGAVALEPGPAVSEKTDRSLPRDEVSAVSVAPLVSSSGVVLERVSVDGSINGVDAPLAMDSESERTEGFALPSPDGHVLTAPSASEEPPVSTAADAISSSQNDSLLSESVSVFDISCSLNFVLTHFLTARNNLLTILYMFLRRCWTIRQYLPQNHCQHCRRIRPC